MEGNDYGRRSVPEEAAAAGAEATVVEERASVGVEVGNGTEGQSKRTTAGWAEVVVFGKDPP